MEKGTPPRQIGRDQTPSRESRGAGHQRLGQFVDHDRLAQTQPLVGQNPVPRRQAIQWPGCLSMSNGSGWVRHVPSALIAFIVLQQLRLHPKETLGEVQDRLQREVMTGGLLALEPLKGRVALEFP